MLSLCATALAENGKTESEKTKEEVFEEQVQTLLENTAEMSDEEIREEFRRLAKENDIEITEKELDRIVKVCRTLEKVKTNDRKERIELIAENFYNGLVEAPDKFLGWLEDVGSGKYTLEDAKNALFNGFGKAADAVAGFFSSVSNFFDGLAGKG